MTCKRILVLSPHTDDAELGCGGAISKFVEEGINLHWIVFSGCEDSLEEGLSKDTLRNEFMDVVKKLNLSKDNYKVFDFRVRHLIDSRQEILEELIGVRNLYKPSLVIIPSLNDFHQDHYVVAREAVRAFKTNASIIGYELPWNHISFNTHLFVKLEKRHIENKYSLLENYKSQFDKKRNYFSKEYIFGLARVRGVQCNANYAEAFEVIRWMM